MSPPAIDLLLLASGQVRHAAALLDKLRIIGQCFEDICLAERQLDLSACIIKSYHEILDLLISAPSPFRADHAYHTSSPHNSASRSLPLLRFHISSSCFTADQHLPQHNTHPCICHTSMPHSRTWLAAFFASGQSSGVPTALCVRQQCFSAHLQGRMSYSSPILTQTCNCSSRQKKGRPCYSHKCLPTWLRLSRATAPRFSPPERFLSQKFGIVFPSRNCGCSCRF